MNSVKPRGGEEIEVVLGAVAAGGKTVVRQDGYVIFVRGGVPGDRVRIRMGRRRRAYGEARVIEVLEPSAHRVEPRCSSFGVCGGCSHQDLEYAEQLVAKRAIVHDTLTRTGGLKGIEVEPCAPSPQVFHYRNKMEFSFARRRWLSRDEIDSGVDGQRAAALGLHVPRIFDKVLEIPNCHIHDPRCDAILEVTREFAESSGREAYDTRAKLGYWRFLVLRTGTATGDLMVHVVTAYWDPELMQSYVERLQERFEGITTIINGIAPRPASAVIVDESHLLVGPGTIVDEIGGLEFEISAASFFQPNTRAADVLYERVAAEAGDLSGKRVFDLYSGAGTISLYLARRAESVVGLELVEPAVENARRNAKRNGIYNAAFTVGDVRGTLGNAVKRHGPPDVLVLDPPRAGNHPKVVEAIVKLAPPRIVHVSCNPATLARDLAVLADAGYRAERVWPVDLFPHTPHVEVVVALDRSS